MKHQKKNSLAEIIAHIGGDAFSVNAFLTDILTPTEYSEVKKRWEIVKMLEAGINQREISKKLNVGIGTVTRGARALKDSKGGFKKMRVN